MWANMLCMSEKKKPPLERTQWGVLHSAVLARRTVDFLVEWPEELQNEPMNGDCIQQAHLITAIAIQGLQEERNVAIVRRRQS
jgi:hypothetical protein